MLLTAMVQLGRTGFFETVKGKARAWESPTNATNRTVSLKGPIQCVVYLRKNARKIER
jgi:hypothetical protein